MSRHNDNELPANLHISENASYQLWYQSTKFKEVDCHTDDSINNQGCCYDCCQVPDCKGEIGTCEREILDSYSFEEFETLEEVKEHICTLPEECFDSIEIYVAYPLPFEIKKTKVEITFG